MSKNILIFSDGTGQAGGVRPDQHLSNVYKLYRASRTGCDSPINPADQVAFYDAGLGTDDDAGQLLLGAVKYLRKLLASATGRGITKNIAECYTAILNSYEPGDRIYLFGFSRGAYTARCVAGVLALCGVPTQGRDGNPLRRYGSETRSVADEAVRRVYEHGAGKAAGKYDDERNELARRFREKYASDSNGEPNVEPYFIGVFDTVASLGATGAVRFGIWASLIGGALVLCGLGALILNWLLDWRFLTNLIGLAGLGAAWFLMSSIKSTFKLIRNFPRKGDIHWHIAKWNMKNYDRRLSSAVQFVRHALAIDETRMHFPRVQWGFKNAAREKVDGEPEWFQQIWFAGNHSDIGGSYAEEESRLSDIALKWMLDEAMSLSHPLIIDSARLNPFPDPRGMQHCEVESRRESYPGWWPSAWRMSWPEKSRTEVLGAPLHQSVFERFGLGTVYQSGRLAPYRPATLQDDDRFAAFYFDADRPDALS